MKKIFSTLMIAAVAAGFIACSSKSENKADSNADENTRKEVPVTNVSDSNPSVIDPNAVAIGVVDLNDDSVLRPDVKAAYPIVIDFNATWCGPCQQFKPAFEAAAEKYAGKVQFISVDTDNNPETAQAFGVTGIPHVVILAPGKPAKDIVGTNDLLPQEKFFNLIDSVLPE